MSEGRPQHLFPLFADITKLNGIGPKTAPLIEKAMGARIKDLLFTPPTSLVDRTERPGAANALAGEVATFIVTVASHRPPKQRNRPYRIRAYDETGDIEITYFKAYPATMEKLFPEGSQRLISGKVETFGAQLQMTHPDYVLPLDKADTLHQLEPLYPLTAGLSQKLAGKAVQGAVDIFLKQEPMDEWLDPAFLAQQEWTTFYNAVKTLHRPEHAVDIKTESPIRRRLAYDELFAKQLAIALVREDTRRSQGREMKHDASYVEDVLKAAPFKPTWHKRKRFRR